MYIDNTIPSSPPLPTCAGGPDAGLSGRLLLLPLLLLREVLRVQLAGEQRDEPAVQPHHGSDHQQTDPPGAHPALVTRRNTCRGVS